MSVDTFDIFERGVQDPCSHDLDDEDETPLILSCPQGHALRKVHTTPHSFYSYAAETPAPDASTDFSTSPPSEGLRRTRTVAHPPRRASRTDSSLFVQQQARRPSCRMRRESSASIIPTHIYGLEKYVSSQLDELSTVPTPSDEDSAHSSVFDSDCLVAQHESALLPVPPHFSAALMDKRQGEAPQTVPQTASSTTPTAPSPQRRPSAIKTSLANSFAGGVARG
ncbi:Isf1 protein [Maudiozyma humilis]|uniref:Isf1 protein n=1 Tax=Maudiozyma humilis TaxID=51915 RepID=A0AAV5S362_MAUHU|nr:Isf1 protein [Kazachstania humilis]